MCIDNGNFNLYEPLSQFLKAIDTVFRWELWGELLNRLREKPIFADAVQKIHIHTYIHRCALSLLSDIHYCVN